MVIANQFGRKMNKKYLIIAISEFDSRNNVNFCIVDSKEKANEIIKECNSFNDILLDRFNEIMKFHDKWDRDNDEPKKPNEKSKYFQQDLDIYNVRIKEYADNYQKDTEEFLKTLPSFPITVKKEIWDFFQKQTSEDMNLDFDSTNVFKKFVIEEIDYLDE
jgi:hypothetical protein